MKNLRQEAKGRECQIRSPKCNRNPETTVLCHVHKPSISGGMGLKGNDMLAAHGCSACHDWCDGRGNMSLAGRIERDIYLYEGVFRTQKILLDEEKIIIKL
jgi:hypothetical protein